MLLNRQQDALPRLKEVILYADPEILGYQTLHGQAWINRALYRYGDTCTMIAFPIAGWRAVISSGQIGTFRTCSERRNGSAELPIVRDRLSCHWTIRSLAKSGPSKTADQDLTNACFRKIYAT